MSKKKVLLQLDCDDHPSAFDAIVAVDAGVEQLLSYGGVTPENVESLVHGAMFTRGPKDLKSTALFCGGHDVEKTGAVAGRARKAFFPGVQVSVMVDPNGANTTAAAAVLSALQHVDFGGKTVLVFGGTGPVGLRIAQLTAELGARVQIASRDEGRAQKACELVANRLDPAAKGGNLAPVKVGDSGEALAAAGEANVVFAAGAAGVRFLEAGWGKSANLDVAIDVNAVPPSGIDGIGPMDAGEVHHGTVCYGAIGVGGLKMKLHKKCLQRLYESNDVFLDTKEIFVIGKEIGK